MQNHIDHLNGLNKAGSLNEKLELIHSEINRHYDYIHRVSVATYDARTGLVKTFLVSSDEPNTLVFYEASLSQAKSLKEIFENGRPRVINDLSVFDNVESEH